MGAVSKKRLQKWRISCWFLLHDDTTALRSTFVKDFLAKNNVATLKHLSCTPDQPTIDFYLFPLLKSAVKGWQFCDSTDGLRMRRKNWKGCNNMASWSILHLSSLCENFIVIFCRKLSLNYYTFCIFQKPINSGNITPSFVDCQCMGMHGVKLKLCCLHLLLLAYSLYSSGHSLYLFMFLCQFRH
jgi:hypothetical protein